MESLDFKQFQVKTTTYKYQDFPCVIEEIPIRVIPHLEKQSETFCFLESAVYSQSKGRISDARSCFDDVRRHVGEVLSAISAVEAGAWLT